MRRAFLVSFLVVFSAACNGGSPGGGSSSGASACVAGQVVACACAGAVGSQGTQTCQADGTYGTCTGCPGGNASSSSSSSSTGGNWTPIGLTGVGINSLVVDPNDSRTLYAGTDQGIFKTTDDAATWSLSNAGLGTGLRRVFLPSSNPPLLVALTFAGPYVSSDGAATWTSIKNDPAAFGYTGEVLDVLVEPGDSNRMLALTASATFVTTDGGASWTPVLAQGLSGRLQRIVRASTAMFVTSDQGVLRSMDNGLTWAAWNEGLQNVDIRGIVVDGSRILVATQGGGVFARDTSGATWTALNNGLGDYLPYTRDIFAGGPAEAWRVAVNANGLFTLDGSSTWQAVGGLTQYPNAVVFSSTTAGLAYAGGVGVFRTTTFGQ